MKKLLLIIGVLAGLGYSQFFSTDEILNRVFDSANSSLTGSFNDENAIFNAVFSPIEGALNLKIVGGSLSLTSDGDTLNFDIGTDLYIIKAIINGSIVFYVDTTGNGYFSSDVGIGTTTPESPLHIKGNSPGTVGSYSAGQIIIHNPTASVFANTSITGYTSNVSGDPVNQSWYLGGESASNSHIVFLNRRNSSLHFGTNNLTRMTVLDDGCIGIATENPDSTLTVTGSGHITENLLVDGELTYGEVEKILFFDLSKMKQGVGNPPGDGIEDGFATYDFDKTTDEETFATFYGPLDWKGGTGADIHLGFFIDIAPIGAESVVFGIEYKSISGGGLFDFSSSTTTVLDTIAITTGTPANDKKLHESTLSIPSEGLIEGGVLMLRVYRDANNGDDDFDDDVRLFEVHIHYKSEQPGKY